MNAVATTINSAEERLVPLHQQLCLTWPSRQTGLGAVVKRAMDIILAVVSLIVLSPVFLLIAIAVVVETGWPVFFTQERLGLYGKPFTVLKFRSMCKDAPRRLAEVLDNNEIDDGPIFKWRDDPRVTRVGRFLRRTSLDELPQLFNVLRGDLSLVGPRPPLGSEVARYEEWQLQRLCVKPGMTGLWQVSGRSTLNFSQMVELDILYGETWTLWQDFVILARTPLAVTNGRGAY
jgi:lipopolysaccharide/colanic/teichoic acid biosynthesis glycosyltransferase